jgi:kumamolisin
MTAELKMYQSEKHGHFRGRTGTLQLPSAVKDAVVAVLGLDNRPIARANHCLLKKKRKSKTTPTPFTVQQVGQLYDFPTNANGSGQTIGIIELGGGYNTADLNTFFNGLNLQTPKVTAVSVDGTNNTPGGDADTEVMLDIEVAGALANGSNIAVYFAPNTEQGFVDAITDAAHDTTNNPSVISISWGGPEDGWSEQGQTALNAALQDAATLGVTVTVAAGDSGSSDGAGDGKLHVDFPAASPYALACGGTTLTASGNNIASETVWNEIANQEGATGGGVSNVFAIPSYQSAAKVPANPETKFAGRGVPDVAGDADPATGYRIVAGGQSEVVGGTSAVAPLYAALIALINQTLGKNVGFINPTLYGNLTGSFNDITTGNNDDSKLGYYSAGPGWDPCTGLGSPNGTAILAMLRSSSAATSGQ